MSFATPTVDVYVPGTTLGLGNVNASTINIGQPGTTVNVGGTMAVTNSVTTPSCTMSSLTTGNLIISPFSGNVAFNNFSAVSANINTASMISASMINASFNSINSSNILIGPYPISGTYTNMNVTNATVSTLNVSNFLITPILNSPTFTNMTIDGNINVSGSISTNSGGFKVVTNTGTNTPQTLLLGTSNDLYTGRFISALNSNLANNTPVYFTMGKTATSGNQLEITYNHVGDNGANWCGNGFHSSGSIISYSNNSYIMIGKAQANLTTAGVMLSGCAANPNSGVIISGNSTRTDGPLIIANTDGNNLMNFANAAGTGTKGNIASTTASSIIYNTTSDKRKKTNIIPMKSMIKKIKELNPAHFVWKEDAIKDDGFIAQEVHKIFPSMMGSITCYCNVCQLSRNDIYDGSLCSCCDWENPIKKNGTDHFHELDYGRFTPYLTKALQETIEIVENQQKQIDNLNIQNQKLEIQLSAILQRLDSGGL